MMQKTLKHINIFKQKCCNKLLFVTILHNIEKNKEYTLGCHADVKEGTEIKIMVYDGEKSEPYQN